MSLPPGRSGRAPGLSWVHWMVVFLSLVLTFGAWYISSTIANDKAEERFHHEVEKLNELVRDRMQNYAFALVSGVGTIAANGGDIGWLQWRAFSQSLAMPERLPGINGIGVIYRIAPEQVDSFIENQRQLRPDFRIHPAHENNDFWPITYIEPEADNAAAIGLDMAHENNRYTAAIKAMKTGTTQITGPIVLVQDSNRTPGFLVYHPFYQTPDLPAEEDREALFSGLVYAPFIMAKLMEGALASVNRLVSFSVIDDGSILYDELSPDTEDYDADPAFRTVYSLEFYGREWQFRVQTTNRFDQFYNRSQPNMILAGGLAIDALILLVFLMLARGKRRAEQEVRERTSELSASLQEIRNREAELSQLNVELEHKRQDAEVAARAKAEFLANMSHEIRTPMNAVMGMLVLLKEARLDSYSGQLVHKAFSAAENLLQLLNDILDLSRLDSRNMEVEVHEFELEDLVQRSIEMLGLVAEEKRIRLQVGIPPDTPTLVSGDLLRISQIVINLIGNALKFTEEGKCVSVNFEVVREPGDDLSGQLRIAVEDAGIGIPADKLEQIFESFRQVDGSTSRRFGGTGLGLAISRKLCDLMGGSIGVVSAEGEGSCFTVSLPVAIPEGSLPLASGIMDTPLPPLICCGLNHNSDLLEQYCKPWRLDLRIQNGLDEAIQAYRDIRELTPGALLLIDTEQTDRARIDEFMARMTGQRPEFDVSRLLCIVPMGFTSNWAETFSKRGGQLIHEPVTPYKLQSALTAIPDDRDSPEEEPDEGDSLPQFRGLSALIVDDVDLNREVVELYLSMFGVGASSVSSGDQAMESILARTPDVVFMDLHLEGESGQEVTRKIRNLDLDRYPLIVGLSASVLDQDRLSALEAGMDDYLTKPVLPENIRGILVRHFRRGGPDKGSAK